MKIFSLFFVLAICDNIEIYLSQFKELHIGNEVIRSDDISGGNSIKISHVGTSIYRLNEIQDKIFKLVDITEYFEDKEPASIRIDVETKVLGLVRFAWKFYAFNVILTVILSIYVPKVIRRLSTKYLL